MRTCLINQRKILLIAVIILISFGDCHATEEKQSGLDNIEYILALTKKYFPKDYYQFLMKVDQSRHESFFENKTQKEALLRISTVFHETAHALTPKLTSITKENQIISNGKTISYYPDYQFPVDPQLRIFVKYFKAFPVLEIDKIAPEEVKKLFRYYVYIKDPTYSVINQSGILWHLDEMNAYNFSFRTAIMLYDIIKGEYGFGSSDIWAEFLGEIASERYAVSEFKIFIALYLQVAKKDHPEIYQRITHDQKIKELFTTIEKEDELHAKEYNQMLLRIKADLGIKIEYSDDNVFFSETGSNLTRNGFGLGNETLKEVQAILQKDDYQILNDLRNL